MAQRATANAAADGLAYILELEKELELALYGFDEAFAVTSSLLIVVIARFKKLATSFITYDENACHTSREARGSRRRRE